MRKLIVILIILATTVTAFSQTPTTKSKKKYTLGGRAGDHFMLQLSRDSWMGAADSVKDHIKGFSRGFNSYLMLDLPFKSDQRFSAALGLGVSTSNIYFKTMIVDISASTPYLPFINVDTLNRFKKFKLTTTYLELPVELRFTANPMKPGKTFKVALGAKVGTLVGVHTKGKNLQDKTGATINGRTEKISSRSYFNSTKLAATARIGYGYFGVFAAYNFTTIFKNAVTPDTKLLQVGLTISGL